MKRKMLAGITALLMAASISGYTANAQNTDDGITIEIDRITLTLDELAALDHTVPVHVRITENAGFDAAEFGVELDERCTFDEDIKWLDYDDGYAAVKDHFVWRALANHDSWYNTGTILRLNMTLPEDAQAGDVFTVRYCPQAYKSHIWGSFASGTDYTAQDRVTWTDGYIEIIETPEDTGFTIGKDDWSFLNDAGTFGTSYYNINSNFYRRLTMGLSNTERERVDSMLFNSWSGACYGMAVTSLLAYNGLMVPSQWQLGAHTLHDISSPPSEEIRSLIHYYYALQKTDMIQQMLANYVYIRTEEEKLRLLMDCLSDGSPTLLTYLDYEWGGHAVAAFDIVSGQYTYNGIHYDKKALLYDSNHSGLADDFCLYFNTDTWEWTIPGYGLDSDKSFLGIITDDIDLLNRHGFLDGTEYVNPNPYISILTSAPLQSEYTISESDGSSRLNLSDPAAGDIRAYASLAGEGGAQEVCFALPDAQSGYEMQLTDPEALALTMNYEDCLLKLDADTAVKAAFDPSGRIMMEGEETDYGMKLVFNDGISTDFWYLHIEGQDADNAELQRTDAGYLLTANSLTRVSAEAKKGESSEILGFSVDAGSVLLYETEDAALGASVDTDGDGSYETPVALSTQMLAGDLTLDNTLSITDVIALSQNLLCGTKLNTAQRKLADYDNDGTPTAADQLAVLQAVIG